MEPTIAIAAVTKLIGLGIKGWNALESGDIDEKDAEAVKTLLETGTSLASMRKAPVAAAAAQHLVLVARSFGQAVGRHQEFHGKLLLTGGLRRLFNRDDRERAKEIEQRVTFAALQLRSLGNDPRGEVELVESLRGSPLGTPYYRKLWQAFSDPALTNESEGEEPPLVMSATARREFERYFLLSYLAGQASPAGRVIRDYLDNLQQYRAVLVRDLLVQDMATWGGRHLFGNVPRERWNDGEPVPFLPLDALYVEPDGVIEDRRGQAGEREPLLALIERLTALDAEPRVVVVAADFGSGKSLSARMLARRWAERALVSSSVALDVVLPVHVRCADDFPHEAVDLAATVRRAWKRQADDFGLSVSDDDDAFAWPSDDQRVVFLLDGLDEVALGDQHLKTLFQKLQAKTTRRHRFVVLSRPGVLPAQSELERMAVVRVQPFGTAQVEDWIQRWNAHRPERLPISLAAVQERGLDALAQTPILLFMVAFTWDQHAAGQGPPSLSAIYEHFFFQIASGKAEVDRERHPTIAAASDALLAALRTSGHLPEGARPPDAMLWLMSRVAWEAHKLEQRDPPEALARRHVESLLHESDLRLPADAMHTIEIGLVLALQSDLRSADHRILFGHQSFREFLVGRYWATQLQRLVRGSEREWDDRTDALLGGRLLRDEDRSHDFLMQLVNAEADVSRPASALAWNGEDRQVLVRWAQEVFADERQVCAGGRRVRDETSLRTDQRAVLREAALAIGSLTDGTPGMRAHDPLTLRSMLAWFWLHGVRARVIAPRAVLDGASLEGAILDGAVLVGARISWARLSGAHLDNAVLSRATLIGAALFDASLSEAELALADLSEAHVSGADLSGANLSGADLSLANLSGANLLGANLQGTNLSGANLQGTNLQVAFLKGAICDEFTSWPEGFDPAAHGAKLLAE